VYLLKTELLFYCLSLFFQFHISLSFLKRSFTICCSYSYFSCSYMTVMRNNFFLRKLFLPVHTHTLIGTLADRAHIIQVELVAHGTGTEPGSGIGSLGSGYWDLDLGLSCRGWQFHFTPCLLGLSFRAFEGPASSSSFSCSLFPYLFWLGFLFRVLFFFLVHPWLSRRQEIPGPWLTFSCTVLSVA